MLIIANEFTLEMLALHGRAACVVETKCLRQKPERKSSRLLLLLMNMMSGVGMIFCRVRENGGTNGVFSMDTATEITASSREEFRMEAKIYVQSELLRGTR